MIRTLLRPDRNTWPALTARATFSDAEIASRVEAILARVKEEGDRALKELTAQIDGVQLDRLEITAEEIAEAKQSLPDTLLSAMEQAAQNIRAFHTAQRSSGIDMQTMPGVRCVQRAVPIRRVGLYVPGGSAPLFSTVLMLAIPAKVAGCPEVVLCTPPGKAGRVAPEVLAAAAICGIDRIFRVGGAQAIAAMGYGTESVPKVDKIFGPGNRYVTKAKQRLSVADVAIDMPAGPSEVMVLADETALPTLVASDLLCQAEHGPDSQAILVCTSEEFARQTDEEVARQLALLPRNAIAEKALANSRIVVLRSREEMIDFANLYAAEHLIISLYDPWEAADKITAAGSIFIGNYSPESAGDYASGTNHTLPTSGWARAFSGVNLDSFTRKITYQELSPEGLESLSGVITAMARAEGLEAHAQAVVLRLEQLKNATR